jgi:hypothetical protein
MVQDTGKLSTCIYESITTRAVHATRVQYNFSWAYMYIETCRVQKEALVCSIVGGLLTYSRTHPYFSARNEPPDAQQATSAGPAAAVRCALAARGAVRRSSKRGLGRGLPPMHRHTPSWAPSSCPESVRIPRPRWAEQGRCSSQLRCRWSLPVRVSPSASHRCALPSWHRQPTWAILRSRRARLGRGARAAVGRGAGEAAPLVAVGRGAGETAPLVAQRVASRPAAPTRASAGPQRSPRRPLACNCGTASYASLGVIPDETTCEREKGSVRHFER